jgi:hypothetical protein
MLYDWINIILLGAGTDFIEGSVRNRYAGPPNAIKDAPRQ